MYCPKCGEEIAEVGGFCGYCGAAISTLVPPAISSGDNQNVAVAVAERLEERVHVISSPGIVRPDDSWIDEEENVVPRTGVPTVIMALLFFASSALLPLYLVISSVSYEENRFSRLLVWADPESSISILLLITIFIFCVLPGLDLFLLNIRRVRRGFLAVGFSLSLSGLAFALGALLSEIISVRFPYAVVELFLSGNIAVLAFFQFVGIIYVTLGAASISVYVCIRILYPHRVPKLTRLPGAVRMIILALHLGFFLWCLICIVLVAHGIST